MLQRSPLVATCGYVMQVNQIAAGLQAEMQSRHVDVLLHANLFTHLL